MAYIATRQDDNVRFGRKKHLAEPRNSSSNAGKEWTRFENSTPRSITRTGPAKQLESPSVRRRRIPEPQPSRTGFGHARYGASRFVQEPPSEPTRLTKRLTSNSTAPDHVRIGHPMSIVPTRTQSALRAERANDRLSFHRRAVAGDVPTSADRPRRPPHKRHFDAQDRTLGKANPDEALNSTSVFSPPRRQVGRQRTSSARGAPPHPRGRISRSSSVASTADDARTPAADAAPSTPRRGGSVTGAPLRRRGPPGLAPRSCPFWTESDPTPIPPSPSASGRGKGQIMHGHSLARGGSVARGGLPGTPTRGGSVEGAPRPTGGLGRKRVGAPREDGKVEATEVGLTIGSRASGPRRGFGRAVVRPAGEDHIPTPLAEVGRKMSVASTTDGLGGRDAADVDGGSADAAAPSRPAIVEAMMRRRAAAAAAATSVPGAVGSRAGSAAPATPRGGRAATPEVDAFRYRGRSGSAVPGTPVPMRTDPITHFAPPSARSEAYDRAALASSDVGRALTWRGKGLRRCGSVGGGSVRGKVRSALVRGASPAPSVGSDATPRGSRINSNSQSRILCWD